MEDVISAIKVSRVPRNVGVALMGSSLKEEQAVKIAKLADNAIIFLDNDNAQVRESQRRAEKLLGPLVRGSVSVVKGDRDPKDYTTAQLEEMLK